MRCTLLILCSFAVALPAQQPQTQQDPRDLLAHVRDKLNQTVDRLPRYMCTQTVDRTQYDPDRTKRATGCGEIAPRKALPSFSDRLRLDVTIAATNEIYSWVGEDRFGDRDLFDLVKQGSLSTGTFSSFLSSIFATGDASFSYNGDTKVDGRLLAEFGFRVPLDRSNYVFGNRRRDTKIPYDGTFLVDPKTFDLVRLVIRTGRLPPETGSCEATTTLDYSRVRLNDAEFLLPAQVQLNILNVDGVRTENKTVFSACHEFSGKSTLTFDDSATPDTPKTAPAGAQTAGNPAEALPAGLSVQLALTQAIDPAKAAAGDKITARLTKPIRDSSSKVLVREGAAVTARILKMQHFYGPPVSFVIALKLESIDVAGTTRPLGAYLASSGLTTPQTTRFMKDGQLTTRVELGSLDLLEDRGVGVFEFRNLGEKYVVKTGFESSWITLAP